jgi:hypothetical protein
MELSTGVGCVPCRYVAPVSAQQLQGLCQAALDAAEAHPFKLASIDGTRVGASWQSDPAAGTEQDVAQYFASSADAARVALTWLADARPVVLPAETFQPSSDNVDAALAATQHVALEGSRVLVVPDRPVDLPNPNLHGMQLVAALCAQPAQGFEMIAFAQQVGRSLVLPHVVVAPDRRPSAELLRHRRVLLIGRDGEVASYTSVQSPALSAIAMRAAGLTLDLVVAALWEDERRRSAQHVNSD